MTGNDRIRIVVVGALAIGVMAGVVAHALANRPPKEEGLDDAVLHHGAVALPPPPRPPSGPQGGKPMPGGCEVEPGHVPAVAIDLPSDKTVPTLDLGTVKQGVVIDRKVTVRNTGGGVLCVSDVHAGCGCVTPEWLGDAHVPAGASGTLRVLVNTANKEGSQAKSITVYTNDPAHPAATFNVLCVIEVGIVVGANANAGILQFGMHSPGEPGTATVRLKSKRTEPEWSIKAVESAEPEEARRTKYTWELVPVEPNDTVWRNYDLKITHPGRVELGMSWERVRITTTHPERPEIAMTGSLHVEKKFYASPDRCTFGLVHEGDVGRAADVHVLAAVAGTPIKVTGARVEGEGFSCEPPVAETTGWRIAVQFDGKKHPPGVLRAKLVIALDDPDVPELVVPIEALVAAGK